MLTKIKKFITPINVFVAFLLIIAFVIRVWRIDQLLGFYYDQGRDALVIWDLIRHGKFFMIGPTTGIAGIFRGPFYYYLIAPFYLLGAGNPVWPSVFLIITSVAALFLMYKIAFEVGGKTAAIVSLILGTFSYEMIYASRWLSNPTSMLFFSMFLIWSLFRILDGNKKYWVWVALVLGLSQFSFGSSGELFYFPAVLIFIIFNWKTFPDRNTLFKSIAVFIFTFVPLVIFNLRHGSFLSGNVENFSKGAFGISSAKFLYDRFIQLISYFSSLIFHAPYEKEWLWTFALFIVVVYSLKNLLKGNEKLKIILTFFLSPIIGLMFFQGNYGNVYGYYLTGYYMIFLVIIGVVLGKVFDESIWGKIFTVIFLVAFINHNWFWTKGMINTNTHDSAIIVLGNEQEAINWIYKDAGTDKFNIDIYVPPVIPHAYNYLLTWKSNPNNVEGQVPKLYTLYEKDPDHPERLKAWLDRQKGIAKIDYSQSFGGIVVDKRTRIK